MTQFKTLPIVAQDAWLKPVESVINRRHQNFLDAYHGICGYHGNLKNYASCHLYLGFHYDEEKQGWFFREWLPRAEEVYLIGDFNGWELCRNPLQKKENGIWEIFLPSAEWKTLTHNSHVKLYVKGANGWHQNIPAYITATWQNPETKDFSGLFWNPEKPFDWGGDTFNLSQIKDMLIYECHIGMAQEKAAVGTFNEFSETIIPRVKELGYTALQIMGLAEHPYYGSFGYHVSNFFAPSSRFGTPEDLKKLVKTAHENGLAVIMDIVHSHFVSNLLEGLNMLDGEDGLYSHWGERGDHPHWKSKLFDYGKEEVRRFLLSNIRYWMEEFHIDGFRFDGVTSMLYTHHGYVDDFGTYDNYFGNNVDSEAITYLTLANQLIHELNPTAITIAEEVSGMPGIAHSIEDGGFGFDYRMGMAIPDYWIKLLKTQADEKWDLDEMWTLLNNRLWNVKTVTYCESHDQALVGDKTIAFRLMDKNMYDQMAVSQNNLVIDRGIALHKLIRFFTICLGGQAYLNFMGNEFGHPEWIDFPREGNNWSYQHALRQWSLVEDQNLKYKFLENFDKAMLQFVKETALLHAGFAQLLSIDKKNMTIVFEHAGCVFLFNFHPQKSISDYAFPVKKAGKYKVVFNSDDMEFGGFNRLDKNTEYFTISNKYNLPYLKVYNLNRTAIVWKCVD